MTDFAEKVRNLKMLPAEDKELLANAAAISYGHAQAILGDLSIFIQKNKKKHHNNYEYYEIFNEDLFYLGVYSRTNLGIFINNHKKILYKSRHYTSHFNAFLENIDACLEALEKIDLSKQPILNFGENFITCEKWFVTYGHFKDEAYNVGDLWKSLSVEGYRPFLDYPTDNWLDSAAFHFNPNYQMIDQLIFAGKSVNAYNFGKNIIKIRNLMLISNGFNDRSFHSFPIAVRDTIQNQAATKYISRNSPIPRNIFITRSNSYRDIQNKTEVENAFSKSGFEIINPEDMSYIEFVNHVKLSRNVAMYYGSALTNMTYFDFGTNVYIVKSQSYMEENISLWKKVIETYKLNVIEILPENNIISIQNLSDLIPEMEDTSGSI